MCLVHHRVSRCVWYHETVTPFKLYLIQHDFNFQMTFLFPALVVTMPPPGPCERPNATTDEPSLPSLTQEPTTPAEVWSRRDDTDRVSST